VEQPRQKEFQVLEGRELPPTAGLPLKWQDFRRGKEQQESFEDGLARFLDMPSVQVECSGTACLFIALETLKRKSNRRTVVIPGYTCPLVPMVIKKAGLRIAVCDTQPDRFDFDLNVLEKICNKDTLCVVPTHLGGLVADLSPALEIAGQNGAWLIEDAAHALGARWYQDNVGTVCDLGFYSFAAGKGLTLYEGGALVARDPGMRKSLIETSREIVPQRIDWELMRICQLIGYGLFYNPRGLSFTYGANLRHWLRQGDPVNAAGEHFTQIPVHKVSSFRKSVGASALTRLKTHLEDNVDRGRRRTNRLSEIEGLAVLRELPNTSATWPTIMVAMPTRDACQLALNELWSKGLGVTKLFIHDLSSYGYLRGLLPDVKTPNAQALSERSLTISNSAWLSDDEFESIVRVLESAAKRTRNSSRRPTFTFGSQI
jgi:dTDP-4-amino-4,6-dideoxygalactose transaminase